MSSSNPEDSIHPEQNLTMGEIENLSRLEGIAQQGLGTYVLVSHALAEIRDRQLYRDSHPSFESYVRERWGVNIPSREPVSQNANEADAPAMPTAQEEQRAALPDKPCEALARACEETLSALSGDDRIGVEIRLAIRKQGDASIPAEVHTSDDGPLVGPMGDGLLPTLRWLLTNATGTIGEVGHQLETRAADIDDDARARLRDDVLVLDGELAVVKALLLELIDWDAELRWLLEDEPPSLDTGDE